MRLFQRPRFWLAIAIFTCFLICFVGPVKVLFDPDILVQQMQRFSCCTVILFVLVYTFVTVLERQSSKRDRTYANCHIDVVGAIPLWLPLHLDMVRQF